MKIENLNFTVRTYNALKRAKIDTVEQLRQLPDYELMCVRGLGRHSLEEIHEKLEGYTMTNGDQIRNMDDEALVKFFAKNIDCCGCMLYDVCTGDCAENWLAWLKKPVRENDGVS